MRQLGLGFRFTPGLGVCRMSYATLFRISFAGLLSVSSLLVLTACGGGSSSSQPIELVLSGLAAEQSVSVSDGEQTLSLSANGQ